jgi:hypothetical protein
VSSVALRFGRTIGRFSRRWSSRTPHTSSACQ